MLEAYIDPASMRSFEKTLQRYIKVSERDVGYIVEKQMRSILIGAKGVQGLVQLFKNRVPSEAKIRKQTKKLILLKAKKSKRLVHAPPKHKMRASQKDYKKKLEIRENIIAARIRGRFFLASTFKFKQWRFVPKKTNSIYRRIKNQRVKRGVVLLVDRGDNPSAYWETKVPGIIKVGNRRNLFSRAIRNREKDMLEYIKNHSLRNFVAAEKGKQWPVM